MLFEIKKYLNILQNKFIQTSYQKNQD